MNMKKLLAGGVMLDKQTVRINRLVRSCVECGATNTCKGGSRGKRWYRHLGGHKCNACYLRMCYRRKNNK